VGVQVKIVSSGDRGGKRTITGELQEKPQFYRADDGRCQLSHDPENGKLWVHSLKMAKKQLLGPLQAVPFAPN